MRLRPIKGDLYDTQPCDRCKALFETHRFFIGDCLHSGFIKNEALKNAISEETLTKIGESKIFRMEKCFACLSDQPIDSFDHL
jgi:hypothetical protein